MGLSAHFFAMQKNGFLLHWVRLRESACFLSIYEINLWFVDKYYTQFLAGLQIELLGFLLKAGWFDAVRRIQF